VTKDEAVARPWRERAAATSARGGGAPGV